MSYIKKVRIHTLDGKSFDSIEYRRDDEADGIPHLLETTVRGERFKDLDIIWMSGPGGRTHCINRKYIVRVELIHCD